jgi:hypothetical protein
MLSETTVVKIIFDHYPDFIPFRENEINDVWKDSPPGIHLEMIIFSDFMRNILENNQEDSEKTKQTFLFIEQFMSDGTEEVQEAVATCFLENLINAISRGRIPAASFVPLLGPESKKYCKAWDEFSKAKTEGLWDDEL